MIVSPCTALSKWQNDSFTMHGVFKMAKWDLGDQKGDPKDLLFVSNVENQVIRQWTAELGLMKLQSNRFLLWGGSG